MCGIHGFITTKKRVGNADDFMMNGFVAGSLRGTDASGIMSISTAAEDAFIQKMPLPGYMFMHDSYARTLALTASQPGMITVGHTRSATAGKMGMAQAHPFVIDEDGRELIGVHNGTIPGWFTMEGGKHFNTDSEWALQQIFDKGADAFKELGGAYCFAFWDSWDPTTLNFALNKERPMHVVFTEEDSMAFASEPGMLYWLCERNRIKMTSEVKVLVPDHWYKFDINNLQGYTKEPLPEKVITVAASSGGSANSYGTRTYTPTTMMAVQSLCDRIELEQNGSVPTQALTLVPKEDTDGLPDTKKQPRSNVKAEEVMKAKDAGLMSIKGTFEPYMYDEVTQLVHGTFFHKGQELAAIIRNGQDLKFKKDDLWICTCIGIQDDGQEVTIVLGWPTRRVPIAA